MDSNIVIVYRAHVSIKAFEDHLVAMPLSAARFMPVDNFLLHFVGHKALEGQLALSYIRETWILCAIGRASLLTLRRRKVRTAAGIIPEKLVSWRGSKGWRSLKTLAAASTRASSIGGEVSCLLSALAATCNNAKQECQVIKFGLKMLSQR